MKRFAVSVRLEYDPPVWFTSRTGSFVVMVVLAPDRETAKALGCANLIADCGTRGVVDKSTVEVLAIEIPEATTDNQKGGQG